jgi:hypothetical protein
MLLIHPSEISGSDKVKMKLKNVKSLEQVHLAIRERFQLRDEEQFTAEYLDQDFDEFVTLLDVAELPSKAKIRVMRTLSVETQAKTSNFVVEMHSSDIDATEAARLQSQDERARIDMLRREIKNITDTNTMLRGESGYERMVANNMRDIARHEADIASMDPFRHVLSSEAADAEADAAAATSEHKQPTNAAVVPSF